ncbi:hypothetical protein ACS0TY_025094 [Phlomoides rotata]
MEIYRKVYRPTLMPITGQSEWVETLYIPPLPPNFGRSVGRPTKARRIEPGEINNNKKKGGVMRMQRQQKTIKCRKCGNTGHNRKTCTQPSLNEEVSNVPRRKKLTVRKNRSNTAASIQRIASCTQDEYHGILIN